MTDIIKLSLYNLLKKRNSYLKVFFSFLIIFLISITTLLFTFSLNNLFDDFMHGSLRENRAGFRTTWENIYERQNELYGIDNVQGVRAERLNPTFLQNITIRLNSQPFVGGQSSSIVAVDALSPTIPKNIELLFYNNYGTSPIMEGGRDIENEGEILISQRIFELHNIPNPEMFINSYITVQGEMVIFDGDFFIGELAPVFTSFSFQLVGILDSRLDSLWSFNRLVTKADLSNDDAVWVEVCFISFDGVEDTLYSLFELFPEVALHGHWWYGGQNIIYDMRFIERVQDFIQNFLLMLIIVIVIMFLASTIFNQHYLLKKNKSFYGILKAKGMMNSKLTAMYFIELLVILLLAQFLGFGLSFALIGILNIPFNAFFGFVFVFTPLNIIFAFLFAMSATLTFAISITAIIYFSILRKETVTLLRGNN